MELTVSRARTTWIPDAAARPAGAAAATTFGRGVTAAMTVSPEPLGTRTSQVLPGGVAPDQHRRLDGRNEILRLALQVLGAAQIPEVRGAGAPDGPVDLHLTRVVRGLGELPGAVPHVEVVEISRGRDRGLLGIEPLVDPAVDAQAVEPRGRRHELPEPFRANA